MPPIPHRPWFVLVALAALHVCGCTAADVPILAGPTWPYEIPDGATQYWYEPGHVLTTFPDDVHTSAEAANPTGLAVDFHPGSGVDGEDFLPAGFTLIEALRELDGFGTTAGIILRFSAPIDPDTVDVTSVQLLRLDGAAAGQSVDYEVEWYDDGATAVFLPLRPLEPAAQHGLAMSREVRALDGGAVWASHALRGALDGTSEDPRLAALHGRYRELLAATGLTVDQVAAATVFTTQSLEEQDREIARQLAEESPTLTLTGPCAGDGSVARCEALLGATDYLGDDQRLDLAPGGIPEPVGDYSIPVSLYLPDDDSIGPWPLVIYGHGLGGDRGEAHGFARDIAGLGMAVAAIDAPVHGDHPTSDTASDLFWIFNFFGLYLDGEASFDVQQLRDHWRQATWDKLQLAAAVRAGLDVDGDGVGDLDGDRIVYSGHSLGATMGAQLLALDETVLAGELSAPGGRVADIVFRSTIFAPLVAMMAPAGTSDGDIARFFPMLQAAIERGDGANWAPHVLDGRRDLLVTMVMDDEVVVNECNRILARALGVEHAPPVLQDVEGLALTGALPLSANAGGRTAVLYQYDEMLEDGELVPADHYSAQDNDLAVAQLRHWWQTWLGNGVAELVDPYDELGL
jgi:dienelactone hydrolase